MFSLVKTIKTYYLNKFRKQNNILTRSRNFHSGEKETEREKKAFCFSGLDFARLKNENTDLTIHALSRNGMNEKNCSRFFNNPISSHHPSINFFPLHFTSTHLLCLSLTLSNTHTHTLSLSLFLSHFLEHTHSISYSSSLFQHITSSFTLSLSPFSLVPSQSENLEPKFALVLPPAQLFS